MRVNNTLEAKKNLYMAKKYNKYALESLCNAKPDSIYSAEEYKNHGVVFVHHFWEEDEYILPDGNYSDIDITPIQGQQML